MERAAAPAPFWKTRPLAALAIGLGIGARIGISWEIPMAVLLILGAAMLLLVILFVRNPKAFLGLWLAMVLAGLGWGSWTAHPQRLPEGDYAMAFTIDGAVRVKETGQVSCYVKDVTLNGQPVGRAYWSFYLQADEPLWPMDDGDRIALNGRMYHPKGQRNPYGFDFERYLLQKGCTVGLCGRDDLQVEARTPLTAYRLRENMAAYLARLIPEESGLAQALLLGDRYDMAEDDRESFQALGIAHVLAVSGLHVGILYGIIRLLMRRCSLGLSSLVTAVVVMVYGWLAGGAPSIVRASILCLTGLMARALWRGSDGLTNLSLAFILLVLWNPMNLVNAGFIMSFTAVLGILLLMKPIERCLSFLPKWLRTSLAMSLSAQLGVSVPVMACYQEIAILGLWLNLAVIPLTSALMALYLAVLALGWTPIGPWLGQIAAWLTRLYLNGLQLLAEIPFATVDTGMPDWTVWAGALVLLVCLSSYVVWKKRYRVLAAAVGVILCLIGWPPREMPPTYIQFSLGQEDGAILMEDTCTLLVDAGESGGDMADYLRAMNRDVDALFISHLHMDHMGGVEALLAEEISIGVCYISHSAREADISPIALELLDRLAGLGVPIIELNAGETLAVGPIDVQVLAPGQTDKPVRDANATSLCLLMDLAGAKILTTGDMPAKSKNAPAAKADVLKVAHHGGSSYTSEVFLHEVQPAIALISCAEGKSLPHGETLARLETVGAAVYRTDEHGAITLTVTPEGIAVKPYLNQGATYESYPVFSGD